MNRQTRSGKDEKENLKAATPTATNKSGTSDKKKPATPAATKKSESQTPAYPIQPANNSQENKATTPTSTIQHSELDRFVRNITDDIVSRITKELKDLRSEFMQRFEIIENNLSAHVKYTNKSIESLQVRVTKLETHLETFNVMKEEVADLQARCDTFERKEVAADAVLLGIPQLPNEDLMSIFNKICHTVQCVPTSLKAAFRTQQQNKNILHNSPIILKFSSPKERNTVLKCVALFHKTNKRLLHLEDIGVKVQGKEKQNIHLHGSLTTKNRSFLRRAMRLKHNGALFTVYTHSGSVFVKESADSESILIQNDATMNAIAASIDQEEETQKEDEKGAHPHYDARNHQH